MSDGKLSLGQAIDQIIGALEGLEAGVRQTAVDAACAHLNIAIGSVRPNPASEQQLPLQAPAAQVPPPKAEQAATDIRSLKEAKRPKSAREMACIVAYYLQEVAPEAERKDSVSTVDLEKYFKQAQFKLPADIGQVLKDAKGSGYFDSPGRGRYKLNAVGYNLVVHKLPSGQASG